MAKNDPYFLCAYGHVLRISKRVPANHRKEDAASMDTFGIGWGGSERNRVTLIQVDGKGWNYLTLARKQELQNQLAIKHKRLTGNVLSGWESVVKDVKGPDEREKPKAAIGELRVGPFNLEGVPLWGITDGIHWFFYAYDTKEEAEALAVDVDSEAKYRANICNEQPYRKGNYFQ